MLRFCQPNFAIAWLCAESKSVICSKLWMQRMLSTWTMSSYSCSFRSVSLPLSSRHRQAHATCFLRLCSMTYHNTGHPPRVPNLPCMIAARQTCHTQCRHRPVIRCNWCNSLTDSKQNTHMLHQDCAMRIRCRLSLVSGQTSLSGLHIQRQ